MTDGTSRAVEGELKTLASQARLLRRLADGLTSGLDMRRVSATVVDGAVAEMGAEDCRLYLFDADGGEMSLTAARGRGDEAASYHPDGGPYRRFAVGEGICGLSAKTGRPVLVEDVHEDPRFGELRAQIRELVMQEYAAQARQQQAVRLSD